MKMTLGIRGERRVDAFTLLEMLVVMLIVAILAGTIFAAGPAILRTARKAQEKTTIKDLEIAITEYFNEYGRYPVPPEMQSGDVMIGEGGSASTADIMNVLLAEDKGWNSQHKLNPKRKSFLNPKLAKGSTTSPRGGMAKDGAYYDLWGTEYRILLDTDYDGEISASQNDQFDYTDMEITDSGIFKHIGGVMIVTYGQDKEMGRKGDRKYKGSDDVASWL